MEVGRHVLSCTGYKILEANYEKSLGPSEEAKKLIERQGLYGFPNPLLAIDTVSLESVAWVVKSSCCCSFPSWKRQVSVFITTLDVHLVGTILPF